MTSSFTVDYKDRIRAIGVDFKSKFTDTKIHEWVDSLIDSVDSEAHRLLISMGIDIKHGLLSVTDYEMLLSNCNFTLSKTYPKRVFEELIWNTNNFHLRLNPFSNVIASAPKEKDYAVIMNFRKLESLYKSNNGLGNIIGKTFAEFIESIKEERTYNKDFGYIPDNTTFTGWGDNDNNFPVFILLWEEVQAIITEVCASKDNSIFDGRVEMPDKISLMNEIRLDERINTKIINRLLDKIGYIRKREINPAENVFFCIRYRIKTNIYQPTSTCGDLWREGKGAYISYPPVDRFGRTYNLINRCPFDSNVKERMHKPFKANDLELSIDYLGEITDNVPVTGSYDYLLIGEALKRYDN